MKNILILGGGFGGVIAAEALAKELGHEHRITLVSRSNRFIFYPALVRLAFDKCELEDVSFDLREAMRTRRVELVEGEIARVDPISRRVTIAHGEVEGNLPYDYLIIALGRRLATEQVTGFFEYANHLLTLESALKFRQAIRDFSRGHAVIGQCPGARLTVPVYETAFALSRLLTKRGQRERVTITIVGPNKFHDEFGGGEIVPTLRAALDQYSIEYREKFPVDSVTANTISTSDGQALNYDLLMLLPPFRGTGAVTGLDIIDKEGYVRVDETMRVRDAEWTYAVGDCVSFDGPKLGHLAVHQAEVAAANLASEIRGFEPTVVYDHDVMVVIDEGSADAIYLHKGSWFDEHGTVRKSRFWNWAKRVHEKYWLSRHS